MRTLRRILAALAVVCMFVPCISMVSHAASGELRFTDPSTTVGAEVEVTAKFTAPVLIDTVEATLTYDSSMLKFISGDSATGGDGTVTISGDGGSSTEASFNLTFQALKEGTANIQVSQSSGVDAVGDALDLTNGSSAVSIGPGDPSLIEEEEGETGTETTTSGGQVEVDGVQYTITSGFSDALIPAGFVKGEKQFEGANCEVVTQEASGRSAFYLTPVDGGEADFFLYDDDNGTFSPFESIEIAQDRYIVLLRDDGGVKLPSAFQETTLTLNGKEFPAWQNTENADYYVVYALNSDGEKGMYQYDTIDKTYQRYVENAPAAAADDKSDAPRGLWGKILSFIQDFLDIIVIIALAVFLLLVIVLIVTRVKLYHRDAELDDLYDEYGIDLDEDEKDQRTAKNSGKGKKKASAVKGGPAVRKPAQTAQIDLDEEDDFDDFDEYEEEDFDDYGTMEMDDLDDYDYDDEEYDYDEDEIIDDLEEMFIEDESVSNKWIMKTLGIKLVKFEEARSIALFFAHCINEIMVREYYRRKKTIFYWLDKRFHLIMEFCKNNDCRIFYNQKLYKFSVDETDVSVQQETTIHDECINFDQLIQEDDEYFIDTGMV